MLTETCIIKFQQETENVDNENYYFSYKIPVFRLVDGTSRASTQILRVLGSYSWYWAVPNLEWPAFRNWFPQILILGSYSWYWTVLNLEWPTFLSWFPQILILGSYSWYQAVPKDELRFCIAMCLLKSEISKMNKYKYKYSQTMTRHL